MRHKFSFLLSPTTGRRLASSVGRLSFTDAALTPLLDAVNSVADVDYSAPSYVRVERRRQGHPWHRDTGTDNHMPWCKWSASMLLTPPDCFTGGGLYFKDAPDEPIFHFMELVVWDDAPENEHMVMPHSGDRRVLIMFLQRRAV